jgi:hypothetical protein
MAKCTASAGSGPSILANNAKILLVSYVIFLLSTVLAASRVYAVIQKIKKVVMNGCSIFGSTAKYTSRSAIAIASIFLIGIRA